MKIKFLLLGILSLLIWTACNDDIPEKNQQANEITSINLDFDIDKLTEMYGPALTRNLPVMTRAASYAYPAGISDIVISPTGEIPAAGQIKTIIVQGTFGSVTIRAFDAVNQISLGQTTIADAGGIGVGSLTIPAYQSTMAGSLRVVMFECLDHSTGAWNMFDYAIQGAEYTEPFTIWTDITDDQDIPKEGGNILVNILGSFPSTASEYLFIRAVDTNNQAVTVNAVIMGTTQKSVYLNIGKNESANSRILVFQYMKSTESTWTPFETHAQIGTPVLPNNIRLINDIYLAKTDAYANGISGSVYSYWHIAMGVAPIYGTRYWAESDGRTANTGCNAYFENTDRSDIGKWRVWTTEEAKLAATYAFDNSYNTGIYKSASASLTGGQYYWTSDQVTSTGVLSPDYAALVHFNTSTSGVVYNYYYKYYSSHHQYRIRCVRSSIN